MPIKTHRDGRPSRCLLHYVTAVWHVCAIRRVLEHILLIIRSDITENVLFHLAHAGGETDGEGGGGERVSLAG